MGILKGLFGGGKKPGLRGSEFSEEQHNQYYEQKEKALEHMLGRMHDIVGHAIIPFDVGGAVDMYYFLEHIKGTGFATMELLDPLGNGPKPNRLGTYELVAFTRLPYDQEETPSEFSSIERRICGAFTAVGHFSFQAVLNPRETCEIPTDGGENQCFIFDDYEPDGKTFSVANRPHHLLLCMEIHRSELAFAREVGGQRLLEELKAAGHYPYSDLNREAVI